MVTTTEGNENLKSLVTHGDISVLTSPDKMSLVTHIDINVLTSPVKMSPVTHGDIHELTSPIGRTVTEGNQNVASD